MKKLLDQLNPEQRLAVRTTEGPVLVLAGAGTGKTRVITVRIAHLLHKKVPASQILAVTFTNKAAGEMKERVAGLVGKKATQSLWVGTFHAFCLEVLRKHGTVVGLPKRFAICDASDQLTAIKGALRELRIPETSMHPRYLQSRISLLKNQLFTPESFLEKACDDREELIGRAWRRYDEHLRRSASVDFDDLLTFAVRALKEPKIQQAYRKKFRYVMVDEYQDTNGPQYEVIHQLAAAHRNLCVVGDDDQSIYGWRGADISKILGFEKDFPGAVVVRLETNYRSTDEILSAANRVIRNNPNRHDKELRSALGKGADVRVRTLTDEVTEADWVAREILDQVNSGKVRLSEIAVLFRTQNQPRVFEAQFRARAIPYRLIGGMSFFDRKEVRDLLAYLKLVANPADEVSLLRIINCPPRGIGKTSLDKMIAAATDEGASLAELLASGKVIEGVSEAAMESIQGFRRLIATLGNRAPTQNLVGWIKNLIEAVGYRTEVDRTYQDAKTREDRWNSVLEVLNFAENHVQRNKRPSLSTFLQELTLTANDETDADDGQREAVTLMTLHSAKGLEFRNVYLVGLEEGLLPHVRSAEEDSVEEERRLAYVGITRAQRQLTITHTTSRAKYGRRVDVHPSRFLFEMRDEPPPRGWQPIETVPIERELEKPKKKTKRKRKKGVARERWR